MQTIPLLILAAMLGQVPEKVRPAKGFDPPDQVRRHSWQPILVEARVATRDRSKIREWRDPGQGYAIVWTARTGGYQGFELREEKYRPLPADRTSIGRARVHRSFAQAQRAINAHWRFTSGAPDMMTARP